MKRLVTYLVIAATLAVLPMGCGRQNRADRAGLVALDSLIATAPDSAAALLQAYPQDSLRTDDDRAYHAMLLTQARYKAYIPAYSLDTINLALAHYADDHDPGKRIRSYLYKGCLFEEQSQSDSAMRYFLMAKENIQDRNDPYMAEILFHLAGLYQSSFTEDEQAIAHYKMAMENYRTQGDSLHVLYCLSELAAMYRNALPDSALILSQAALDLSQRLNNDTYYCVNLSTMAGYFLFMDDCGKAKELALTALSNPGIAPVTRAQCLNTACQALANQGKPDSAQLMLDMVPLPVSVADSVNLMRSHVQLAYARGDWSEYMRLSKLSDDMTGDVLVRSLKHQLATTRMQYEQEQERLRFSNAKSRTMGILAVCLVLLLAVAVALLVFYRRSVRRQIEWERAKTQMAGQLSKSASENAMRKTYAGVITQALATVSYLGKKGSSSFKDDKELVAAQLPDKFWNDAEEITSAGLVQLLKDMDGRGVSLKDEEKKVLCLCYCGIPDVVVAKLMGYTSRRTVHNIKSAIARKLVPDGRSLNEIVAGHTP